jgi:excisionase family DNA binding protein
VPHAYVAQVPFSDRAAFSLAEVSGLTGLSVSGLYKLINGGQLRSTRIGGRRLVPREALEELINTCPSKRKQPVANGTDRAR